MRTGLLSPWGTAGKMFKTGPHQVTKPWTHKHTHTWTLQAGAPSSQQHRRRKQNKKGRSSEACYTFCFHPSLWGPCQHKHTSTKTPRIKNLLACFCVAVVFLQFLSSSLLCNLFHPSRSDICYLRSRKPTSSNKRRETRTGDGWDAAN